MTGPITWEVLIAMGTILGAIVGVWLRIEYRIGAEIAERIVPMSTSLAERIGPMSTSLAALHSEVRLLDKQLAEHKLHAAETYARHNDVREMREEIVGRLDALNGRLDKALAPVHGRARAGT